MKTLFITALAVLSASLAQAQSKVRDVISSGGGNVSTATLQMSYTIGETAIQYLSASGASLSQGFQQVNNGGTSINDLDFMDAQVSTYPNPFINFIEIKTDKIINGAAFHLADARGKKIEFSIEEIADGKHWRLTIVSTAAGNYWLSIFSEGKNGTYILTHAEP